MAVIFWAVGGVVASAVLHDDHSVHSDYDNYSNHSDYSDYAERQRRVNADESSETSSLNDELVLINNILDKNAELEDIARRQAASLEEMLKRVAESLEATRKGMKFINEYENSFNIAVFGKVKAGKSYTGKFVMGNVIRDLGMRDSGLTQTRRQARYSFSVSAEWCG